MYVVDYTYYANSCSMAFSVDLTASEVSFLVKNISDIIIGGNEHYGSYVFEELSRVSQLIDDHMIGRRGGYTVDVNTITPEDAYAYLFGDTSLAKTEYEKLVRFESTQIVYTSEEMWILVFHSGMVLDALSSPGEHHTLTITSLACNSDYQRMTCMPRE
uniref:Uncharacterized protein n=1 Tax=viral metagenome TaxID=1070528 RepID=A0A6C0LXV6_9ZZZZ